jgi:hypothetical protein
VDDHLHQCSSVGIKEQGCDLIERIRGPRRLHFPAPIFVFAMEQIGTLSANNFVTNRSRRMISTPYPRFEAVMSFGTIQIHVETGSYPKK